MFFTLYKIILTFLTPFVPRFLYRRLKQGKENPKFVRQKMGFYDDIESVPENLIWFHFASIGEGNSILPLVKQLTSAGKFVLLTSGTLTSQELLKSKKMENVIICHAPLDIPLFINRFFKKFKPSVAIFVESEVWPNLIFQASKKCRKLISLNTRFSPKSLRFWRYFPFLFRDIFRKFDYIFPQTQELASDIQKFFGLKAQFIGNLKYDISCDHSIFVRPEWSFERKIFLLASTHGGEELIISSALKDLDPSTLVIVCPRHLNRLDEILDVFNGAKVLSRGEIPSKDDRVFVWDKFGDMMFLYWLCDACFVGGSLVTGIGGHNVFEPAFFGKPIVIGPFYENWRDIVNFMLDKNLLIKSEINDLKNSIHLAFSADFCANALNAQKFCLEQSGGTQKAFEIIYFS